ncbi:MAG: hypothetical protein WBA28_07890, partial [Microbacteriaceae bacterium]
MRKSVEQPSESRGKFRSWSKRTIGLGVTLFVAFSGLIIPANSAQADVIKAVLETNKVTSYPVSKVAYSGDQVTFDISSDCQSLEMHCWDAVLSDSLPAPLEMVDVTFTSNGDFPDPIVSIVGNSFTATFQDTSPAFPGKIGLQAGHGLVFQVTAKVPDNAVIPPEGLDISNTAYLNSPDPAVQDDESTDVVQVQFKTVLTPVITKSWTKDYMVAGDNSPNSFVLSYKNNSNVPVQTMNIVDPSSGTNPFDSFEFAGFDASGTASIFPQGSDRLGMTLILGVGSTVQMPGLSALPTDAEIIAALGANGKTMADVIGYSLNFYSVAGGNTIVPGGTAGTITTLVRQRTSVAAGTADLTVPNHASANVKRVGEPASPTVEANDDTVINPQGVEALASKTFMNASGVSVNSIMMGEEVSALLVAESNSNVRINSLSITEPAVGKDNLAQQGFEFKGFGLNGTGVIPSANIPAGVTGASVVYTVGGVAQPAVTGVLGANGITFPAPPAGITGFKLSVTGDMAPDAKLSLGMKLKENRGGVSRTIQNFITAGVTSGTLNSESPEVNDQLGMVEPIVDSRMRKVFTPLGVWGLDGARVTNMLEGRLDSESGTSLSTIPVTEYVIEDSINVSGTGNGIWSTNFVPDQLRPVALPTGVQAKVEVLNADGLTWVTMGSSYTGTIPAIDLSVGTVAPVKGVRITYTPAGTETELPVIGARYKVVMDWEAQGDSTSFGAFENCATGAAQGRVPAGNINEVEPSKGCATVTIVEADDPVNTDPGTVPPGFDPVVTTNTAKEWTIDGADANSRKLNTPIWITDGAVKPKFGLTVGVENESEVLSLNTLSLMEPALATVDHPQTNPFDFIQLVSLEDIHIPENTVSSSVTMRLFEGLSGTAFAFEKVGTVADVIAAVNAYLVTPDGKKVVRFSLSIDSEAPDIESWDRLSTRWVVQVRDAQLSSGTDINLANFPNLNSGIMVPNTVSGTGTITGYPNPDLSYASHGVTLRALTSQTVTVQGRKSFDPTSATALSGDPDRNIEVSLGANRFAPTDTKPDLDSYSYPNKYQIEDLTPEFWDAFELKGLKQIIGAPNGAADQVKFSIQYRVGGSWSGVGGTSAVYNPAGSSWVYPEGGDASGWSVPTGNNPSTLPAGSNAKPTGHEFRDVSGIRIIFWTDNPEDMLPDRGAMTASNLNGFGQYAKFNFDLRVDYRSDRGALIDSKVIDNEMTVQA